MSHSNYTRNILYIKDDNIIFEENCLEFPSLTVLYHEYQFSLEKI